MPLSGGGGPGVPSSLSSFDNANGGGLRECFRGVATSPMASNLFIAVVDLDREMTLGGVVAEDAPSTSRVSLALGGVTRGLLAATCTILFDVDAGVVEAETVVVSVTTGGVGGRRGAAAADFLPGCGGVGGPSDDWALALRCLEVGLDVVGMAAAVVCLMGSDVGRALFRTTGCTGEDGGFVLFLAGDKDDGFCRDVEACLPPELSASNKEISESVVEIGCESTVSTSCSAFTLCICLGFRNVVGVGLPPRLAANVAAMRLGLLAPSLTTPAGYCGESPRDRCDDGEVDGALAAATCV